MSSAINPNFVAAMGNRVRTLRESAGLTQDELAARLGYKSKASISRIESGEHEIPLAKMHDYADALGTTISHLMGWDIKYVVGDLSEDEAQLIRLWRNASDVGKAKALGNLEATQKQLPLNGQEI